MTHIKYQNDTDQGSQTYELRQTANLAYTAPQVEGILNKARMTISRYARTGLLQKFGHNQYTKESVDKLRRMSSADIRQYLAEAVRRNPELAGETARLEYAAVVELTQDPANPTNPFNILFKYAALRKRTASYPLLYLLETDFLASPLGQKLYEALRTASAPTLEIQTLPYPKYRLDTPDGMQESCIRVFSGKDFRKWQIACEGSYIPVKEATPVEQSLDIEKSKAVEKSTPAEKSLNIEKSTPPQATLPPLPEEAIPLPEATEAGNSITLLTDGRQAILRDDRMLNLHAEKDLKNTDRLPHRKGLNRLHYAPDPSQAPTQARPRLHNVDTELSHLSTTHSLQMNQKHLDTNADLRCLLEDQLEEEQEVIDYFIAALNRYLYRLTIRVRREGLFPTDPDGHMILPDRPTEYDGCLPDILIGPYSTEARAYPPGYLTSFRDLTQALQESVKDGTGVPRTHLEKAAILREADEIDRFLR